jgi:DNA-binding SARP family transcriptional activator/DNA-binding beta-propeller fold protein YncE
VVSTDRIIEVLWGERPPGTATKAMQGYVSHLRRELGGESGDARRLLVTQSPGYVLHADAVSVDATRFEQLADDGRRALEDGAAAEAARLLDEALALWRGPALAEFAYEDFAREEIDRLEQLRLSVTEDRIDALLDLGRHGELAGKLAALVAANPLRERIRGQWMLSLYRSGRQADALQAYRDGRRLSASELGLEPGQELQRLERAILSQDPALEAPPPPRAPRSDDGNEERPPLPAGRARRRRIIAGGALLVAAAAVAVLAIVLSQRGPPAPIAVVPPAVVAVDAKTDRVVASIPTGSEPTALVAGLGGIWVGDARDGTVTRIDPRTRQVVKRIGIAAPAIDLATGLGSVWAATGGFGQVVRIDPGLDPSLGGVVDRISLGTPGNPIIPTVSAVAVGGGSVWAGAFDGLARIDPASHKVVPIAVGNSAALEIAIGDGALWATLGTARSVGLDLSTGRQIARFYAGVFAPAIALDRSAVWLAAIYGGQLWKFDPVTGLPILSGPVHAGASAKGIALGARAVWLASWSDDSLVKVDQVSGRVLATIPLPGSPVAVAFRDGVVWVAVQPAETNG